MKRMLVAAVVLAAIAIMAFGAISTGAWFTDTDTVANNTLAAGKLDIDLRDAVGSGTVLPINVANMAPSEDDWVPVGPAFAMNVYDQNTPVSTLPAKYRFSFVNIVPTGAANLNDALRVRLYHGFGGSPFSGDPWIVWEGSFNAFVFQSTHPMMNTVLNDGIVPVNGSHVYQFKFHLDENAGNAYQGASVQFDLKVDAFQEADPVF